MFRRETQRFEADLRDWKGRDASVAASVFAIQGSGRLLGEMEIGDASQGWSGPGGQENQRSKSPDGRKCYGGKTSSKASGGEDDGD